MRRLLCVLAVLLALTFVCVSASAEEPTGSMELQYAENFSVDYYTGGAARLRIQDQDFLVLPADAPVPEGLEKLTRIAIPVKDFYLASSSVPDLFLQMDALDSLRYTSTDAPSWRIPELRAAVENEGILYIG